MISRRISPVALPCGLRDYQRLTAFGHQEDYVRDRAACSGTPSSNHRMLRVGLAPAGWWTLTSPSSHAATSPPVSSPPSISVLILAMDSGRNSGNPPRTPRHPDRPAGSPQCAGGPGFGEDPYRPDPSLLAPCGAAPPRWVSGAGGECPREVGWARRSFAPPLGARRRTP
jgi:hypothetical protein